MGGTPTGGAELTARSSCMHACMMYRLLLLPTRLVCPRAGKSNGVGVRCGFWRLHLFTDRPHRGDRSAMVMARRTHRRWTGPQHCILVRAFHRPSPVEVEHGSSAVDTYARKTHHVAGDVHALATAHGSGQPLRLFVSYETTPFFLLFVRHTTTIMHMHGSQRCLLERSPAQIRQRLNSAMLASLKTYG
jgi:hypothetical protein